MSKPVRFVRSAEQADAEMGDASGADDADVRMADFLIPAGQSRGCTSSSWGCTDCDGQSEEPDRDPEAPANMEDAIVTGDAETPPQI